MRVFANHRAAGRAPPRRDGTAAVTDQSPHNPGITPLPPIALVARVRGLAPERLFPLHELAACADRLARICARPRDPKRSSLSGLRPFRASPA